MIWDEILEGPARYIISFWYRNVASQRQTHIDVIKTDQLLRRDDIQITVDATPCESSEGNL